MSRSRPNGSPRPSAASVNLKHPPGPPVTLGNTRELSDTLADRCWMAKRPKMKTMEDLPWPPLDWEPPPLREGELAVLKGELAKLYQLNVKPKRR